jgi:hypothetical protein
MGINHRRHHLPVVFPEACNALPDLFMARLWCEDHDEILSGEVEVTDEQEKGIGGLSVDEGTADAEPACPARFGQRPAFGKANKLSVTI